MTPPSSSNTPYYAVIFTATRNTQHDARYGEMAGKMVALATTMPGYIGIEGGTVSPKSGITVSYWDSEVRTSGADWRGFR